MQSSREEILVSTHAEYQSLLNQCRQLDQSILNQVPNWQDQDQMTALLANSSIDIALLMLGADREYSHVECQAFNCVFALHESDQDIVSLAQSLQERVLSEPELFAKLDRFALAVTLSRPLITVELLDRAMSFFDSLAQVMALIDEEYHPQEDAFYQRLCKHLRMDIRLSQQETLLLKLTDGQTFNWPQRQSAVQAETDTIDLNMLNASRSAFIDLVALYQPLDDYIIRTVSNWLPSDHFCAQLASLCEDTALVMLGADDDISEIELWAFNTIFALHESHQDIEVMTRWLNQKQTKEDELFTRLDRFMLNSALVDQRMGMERTPQALAYFQALGQVIALVDSNYEIHEDMFYRELLQRIEKSWRQLNDFVQESEPAIMLNLTNGATQLFHLS